MFEKLPVVFGGKFNLLRGMARKAAVGLALPASLSCALQPHPMLSPGRPFYT